MSFSLGMDPGRLSDRARDFSQESEALKASVDKMAGWIGTLEEDWKGDAARKYVQQFGELRPHFQNMYELIGDLSKQLQGAADAMVELDREMASRIGVQ